MGFEQYHEPAQELSAETRTFAREDYRTREDRDRAMAGWLGERGVELVVLAGYMQLLGDAFLGAFPGRVINVHPALLPAFPGLGAIQQFARDLTASWV